MSIEQWDGELPELNTHTQCMLEHNGKVVEVTGSSVVVETERRSACEHCSVGDHCETSIIAGVFKHNTNRIRLHNHIDNDVDLKAGDEVVLGIPEQLLLRAAIWAYMVPILSMFVFALIAKSAGYPDIYIFFASLFGLVNGFYLARVSNTHRMSDEIVLLGRKKPDQQQFVLKQPAHHPNPGIASNVAVNINITRGNK